MRIFLTKPRKWKITPFITMEFDGQYLRTIFNEENIESITATSGEIYYVQPNGSKIPPVVKKQELPESRGQKIAFALDFDLTKIANSFEDFWNKYDNICHTNAMSAVIQENFALVFVNNINKGKITPTLAFVDDNISSEELAQLIDRYISYRKKLYCPEDFLKIL